MDFSNPPPLKTEKLLSLYFKVALEGKEMLQTKNKLILLLKLLPLVVNRDFPSFTIETILSLRKSRLRHIRILFLSYTKNFSGTIIKQVKKKKKQHSKGKGVLIVCCMIINMIKKGKV